MKLEDAKAALASLRRDISYVEELLEEGKLQDAAENAEGLMSLTRSAIWAVCSLARPEENE